MALASSVAATLSRKANKALRNGYRSHRKSGIRSCTGTGAWLVAVMAFPISTPLPVALPRPGQFVLLEFANAITSIIPPGIGAPRRSTYKSPNLHSRFTHEFFIIDLTAPFAVHMWV